MRRIFLIILGFFLVITTAGMLFMGSRLFTVKERVGHLAEAQKSMIKRTELRDIIHELKHAAMGEKMSEDEIIKLKARAKTVVGECYGCHSSGSVFGYIKDIENRISIFDKEVTASDFYHRPEKVLFPVNLIIPFVEDSYRKAKSLADTRMESVTHELHRIRLAGVTIALAGFFLFMGFSIVSLKRVSRLETDVKERERVLHDWAEQWQRTFDSIQDMVFIMDKDCRISMMNDTAMKTCKQCAKGKGIDEALDNAVKKACQSVCREGAGKEITLGNNVFTVRSFRMHPDADEGGCVLVIRDITAEREMELRIIQAEKLAALGQMIAGVAHELNNPLSAINGFSELLLSTAADDNVKNMADKISKSAERASSIVHDLLVFSRAPKLEKAMVNIKGMIYEVVDLVSEALHASKIDVSVDVSDDIVASLDKSQMERVLLNLVTNSIHALRDSKRGDRILLKVYKENNRVFIEVSDNGPGIPGNVIQKIFEPFFTTKGFGKGTGLGLSICYNIVRAHGGNISVNSKEGEGTAFVIELPYQELQ
ncbi:MAG: ATP-binding protein [Nitrospirota bacterium]